MSAFDKIIGYSSLKKELMQISDTLKNREFYDKLGVSAPRGLLLHGEPGVGKSLMASAVIEDSGTADVPYSAAARIAQTVISSRKSRSPLTKPHKARRPLCIWMIWINSPMETNSVRMQKNMSPCSPVSMK